MTRIEEALRAHWWVLALLLVTLAGTVAREGDHPAIGGVLAATAVLALLARTRSPAAAVVVNAAATTAYFASGYADGPIYLSVFLCAYALAVRRPTANWWPWLAAYVALAVGLVVRFVVDDAGLLEITARVGWFLTLVAASFAVGVAVRSRGETRRERGARAATEERVRMAEDLHDGVGHGLAVIAMQAGVALHVLEKDPASVRASLEAIRDTSREALDALRTSLSQLATVGPDGAPRSPRHGLADLDVLLARVRAGGLVVSAEISTDAVTGEADETAYVVVQEALTNVLRHAHASSVQVRVTNQDGALLVSVRDDGQGGVVDSRPGSGLGIPGLRARVERLGGAFDAGPIAGGFAVTARIPTWGRA